MRPADRVRAAAEADANISWCGALVDEAAIAEQMRKSHAVFVPGESGLSVVHTFAYGKPYITCGLPELAHGPEIAYLRHGENGLLLAGSFDENVARIQALLQDAVSYERACHAAFETARALSVENWCTQMGRALTQEITQDDISKTLKPHE